MEGPKGTGGTTGDDPWANFDRDFGRENGDSSSAGGNSKSGNTNYQDTLFFQILRRLHKEATVLKDPKSQELLAGIMKELGASFAKVFKDGASAFSENFNSSDFFANLAPDTEFSKKLGAWIATGFSDFVKSMGDNFDANNFRFGKGGQKFFANILEDIADGFEQSDSFGRMGENAGENFKSFFDNLFGSGPSFQDTIFENANDFGDNIIDSIFRFNLNWLMYVTPFVFGSWSLYKVSNHLYNYVYQKAIYNLSTPKLAIKTRFYGWTDYLFPYARKTMKKPIFNPKLQSITDDLIKANFNIRKHKGYFQRILFYGPPGTGKTMISEYIAEHSNMNFIMMSGGDLGQYIKQGKHVTEFNKLVDAAEKSSTPTVLFIDEAESMCRDRKELDVNYLELQNAFLNRTGTPSKKILLILATNRLWDIDDAVLSRMDYKVRVGFPEKQQRKEIMQLHLGSFFTQKDIATFFSNGELDKISDMTEGLSGRQLFQLLNSISSKKALTNNNKLTHEIIIDTAKVFVEQIKEVDKVLDNAQGKKLSTRGA